MISKYCEDFTMESLSNGHISVELRSNGRSKKLTTGGTPSCPHAFNQFERDVRKAMKEVQTGEKQW